MNNCLLKLNPLNDKQDVIDLCGNKYTITVNHQNLWCVNKHFEVIDKMSHRILDGASGTKNKYIVCQDFHKPNYIPESLGKFHDHGVFLYEYQALNYSNELISKRKVELDFFQFRNNSRLINSKLDKNEYVSGWYCGELHVIGNPLKSRE